MEKKNLYRDILYEIVLIYLGVFFIYLIITINSNFIENNFIIFTLSIENSKKIINFINEFVLTVLTIFIPLFFVPIQILNNKFVFLKKVVIKDGKFFKLFYLLLFTILINFLFLFKFTDNMKINQIIFIFKRIFGEIDFIKLEIITFFIFILYVLFLYFFYGKNIKIFLDLPNFYPYKILIFIMIMYIFDFLLQEGNQIYTIENQVIINILLFILIITLLIKNIYILININNSTKQLELIEKYYSSIKLQEENESYRKAYKETLLFFIKNIFSMEKISDKKIFLLILIDLSFAKILKIYRVIEDKLFNYRNEITHPENLNLTFFENKNNKYDFISELNLLIIENIKTTSSVEINKWVDLFYQLTKNNIDCIKYYDFFLNNIFGEDFKNFHYEGFKINIIKRLNKNIYENIKKISHESFVFKNNIRIFEFLYSKSKGFEINQKILYKEFSKYIELIFDKSDDLYCRSFFMQAYINNDEKIMIDLLKNSNNHISISIINYYFFEYLNHNNSFIWEIYPFIMKQKKIFELFKIESSLIFNDWNFYLDINNKQNKNNNQLKPEYLFTLLILLFLDESIGIKFHEKMNFIKTLNFEKANYYNLFKEYKFEIDKLIKNNKRNLYKKLNLNKNLIKKWLRHKI